MRGRGRGLFVSPTALDAKNLRYLRGGFVTRPGLENVFTGTAAVGAKATHIGQLITQENERQVLVVTSDGQLWREPDAGVALTNLKNDWAKGSLISGATIGHSATLFDREHLAISDSSRIGVGSPLLWDRTNLDRMSPSGPGKSHTLVLGAAGSNTNGIHKVVVIFVTRTGHLTTPSDSVEITVTGNAKIDVSNIPTGPDWVVQRIIAMTEADGATYFYDPSAMVIDDNTTTTLTIDIADASLIALNNVDNLFRLESLPEVAGMVAYRDRIVTWGVRKRILLPNLDFDGGFDPAVPAVPAGWVASSTVVVNEGPNDPTAASVVGGGWTNPTNIFTSDNVYATNITPASGEILRAETFAFGIPGGATIQGIIVKIERKRFSSGDISDLRVQLKKAAAVGGNKASAVGWPIVDTVRTYGSSTDLWGTTWTVAEINASNFGVELEAQTDDGLPRAEVDHITITVFYTVAGGGSAGGAKEESVVYLGHSYKITGDGAADIRGDIQQAIATDFAEINFPINTKIRFRVRARRSSGLLAGAVRFALDNTDSVFLLTAATLTTEWAVYESSPILIQDLPTILTLRGDSDGTNPLTNLESVYVDAIGIAPDNEPFQASVLRVSDPVAPQSFDGVRGIMNVSPDDGQKVVSCFVFRGMLFIVKERSLYVTRDDGVNPPALWTVDFVDKVGCDGVHAVAVAGQSFALLLYRDGIYVIRGLLPQDISDELQDSPVGLPSMDDREEAEAYRNHIAIEDEKTEAHFAIVRSGDTWPERVFKLNYRHGWGMEQRRWSYDEFKITASDLTVGASALIQEATKQRIFFGAETGDIERHEGNDDLGNDIATNWRSAYLSFLGLAGARGKSIFNAVVMHGETLGTSPELDINGYKMDNTQVVLINNATLSLATLFERRINQIVEKMSFEINVAGTGDPRVAIDSLVLYGRPLHLSGAM